MLSVHGSLAVRIRPPSQVRVGKIPGSQGGGLVWSVCFFVCFTIVLSHWNFSHGKFGLLPPGKASSDSGTIQPRVRAGCFIVSIIHQTLTWTTGSLTCAQVLAHVIAHVGVRTP